MKIKNTFSYVLLGGLGLLLALQGCGDDGDENAKPPVIGDAGSGGSNNTSGSGGKSGGGKSGGGTDNEGGTDNTGNTGGTGATGAVGGEGGSPFVPECNLPELGEDGCFNCPENGQTEQFLNRCLDTDCEPFDNDRLPQLEADGSLPDLP